MPVVYALTKELKRVSSQLGDTKVKVTAVSADLKRNYGDTSNAQIFPGGSRFFISPDNVEEFVRSEILTSRNQDTQSTDLQAARKRLMLVCVHASRDKVCGTKGPALQVPTSVYPAVFGF